MIRVLLALLLWSLPVSAAQLPSCLSQNDVFTAVIANSATLSSATFNFDDLTGTIVFKGTTYPRIFTNTNLNAIQQFAITPNPDSYFTTFSRTYHETLLAQTTQQICPLLNQNGAFLLTH